MEPRFIRLRVEAVTMDEPSPSPVTSQEFDALVEVWGHLMDCAGGAPHLGALVPRLEAEVAVFMDARPGHLAVNFEVDEAELLTTLNGLDDAHDQQLAYMLRDSCAAG